MNSKEFFGPIIVRETSSPAVACC